MIDSEAQDFYSEILSSMSETGIDFLLGGGFAVSHYTGIRRDTKDMDIFLRVADYPKVLKHFADKGIDIEYTDVRWLAKIKKGKYYTDLIFNSVHGRRADLVQKLCLEQRTIRRSGYQPSYPKTRENDGLEKAAFTDRSSLAYVTRRNIDVPVCLSFGIPGDHSRLAF
jgi:hypothetical protein